MTSLNKYLSHAPGDSLPVAFRLPMRLFYFELMVETTDHFKLQCQSKIGNATVRVIKSVPVAQTSSHLKAESLEDEIMFLIQTGPKSTINVCRAGKYVRNFDSVHTMPEYFENDEKFNGWASLSHENGTFFAGRFRKR